MVSIDGSVDESHKVFSGHYPSLRAAVYPVAVTPGEFEPWIPDPSGVSTRSQDLYGNCVALTRGYCAARQDFPEELSFALTLKLSSVPAGWLWGRLVSPLVSYETNASGILLKVEAKPAQVPAVAFWVEGTKIPRSTGMAACSVDQMCGYAHGWNNPNSVEDWRPFYKDKASWVRGHWSFNNVGGTSARESGSCFSDESTFHGLVATNASYSNGGPPTYSTNDKTFSYTVGSPHYDENNRVLQGFYSLLVRSSTAKCLYGVRQGSMSASVSVTEGADGIQETSVVNVVDDGKWLRVNASGFHYSKPDIKVRLTSNSSELTEPPAVVSTTTTTTTVVTTTSTTVATPSVIMPKVSKNRLTSALSIATFAKIKVLSTSKVSLRVVASSAKYCKVSGSAVKGLRAGSCKVSVIVTPKKGKATSKTVTLKVAQ